MARVSDSQSGGRPCVCIPEAPAVRVSAKAKGKEWVFSVAGNGVGIASAGEALRNGIALSICKKIVEQHGGKI
jgi:light-regulated signal transduction histidine kinase (bacteriophytochrome)